MDKTNSSGDDLIVAHIGDQHLRASQYGSKERSEDFFRAALSALEACRAAGVRVVCNAGDILDSPRPPASVIVQLKQLHNFLVRNEMLMLSVSGNHDWSDPAWIDVIGNPADAGQDVSALTGIVPIDGKAVYYRGRCFVGIRQMTPRKFCESKDAIIAAIEPGATVIFHGTVQGIVPLYVPGEYSITADDFGPAGVVLLGDLHKTGYVTNAAGALVGYCGSTEVCESGEDVDKVVPLISLNERKVVETLPVITRQYIEATVTEPEHVDNLIERLRASVSPVVIVQYARALHKELQRLWAVATDSMLLRCRPLPTDASEFSRPDVARHTGERKTLAWFIRARVAEHPQLHAVSEELAERGLQDGFTIVEKFIESRK